MNYKLNATALIGQQSCCNLLLERNKENSWRAFGGTSIFCRHCDQESSDVIWRGRFCFTRDSFRFLRVTRDVQGCRSNSVWRESGYFHNSLFGSAENWSLRQMRWYGPRSTHILTEVKWLGSVSGSFIDSLLFENSLSIAEAFLADDETVDAEVFLNKASSCIQTVTDVALLLRYRATYARVLDANRKFVEAAMRYYDLSNTTYADVSSTCYELLTKYINWMHHRTLTHPSIYTISYSPSRWIKKIC